MKPEQQAPSKEVVPVTIEEKVKEQIKEALKESALARTSAITLSELEYAEDLSQALLKQATSIEDLYKEVQGCLKKGDHKALKQYSTKIEEKASATQKMQARPAAAALAFSLMPFKDSMFLMSIIHFLYQSMLSLWNFKIVFFECLSKIAHLLFYCHHQAIWIFAMQSTLFFHPFSLYGLQVWLIFCL